MSAQFYPLPVVKINKETEDAVSVSFKVPDELTGQFYYKPGQYLNFKFNVNGESLRRSYSLCSSPVLDQLHTVTVKKVQGGKVSNYINEQLKEGDVVEVMPPIGKFYVNIDLSNSKTYVLLGGGSGITPLMSILKTVLHEEPHSKVVLIYANRDENSIIFRETLDKFSMQYEDRFTLVYSLDKPSGDWDGLSGYFTIEKLSELFHRYIEGRITHPDTHYYVCGPSGLMDLFFKALDQNKISKNNIHKEFFTSDSGALEKEKEEIAATQKKLHDIILEEEDAGAIETREVTVILNDVEHKLTVGPDQTILEAALDADLDAPYSCQSGICSTCRAKLMSGRVYIEEWEGLTDEELEEKFILTCQSHPLSDDVKVAYSL